MNTKVFIYSMHYIPQLMGIPDVLSKPVLNKVRLYGAKAKTSCIHNDDTNKDKWYITVIKSKELDEVKGKLYAFWPTTFKSFEKSLFKKYPLLIRTMCVVLDMKGKEYKAVTYLLDNSQN